MSRIGRPLIIETGKPRVLPKTLPVPAEPVKEPGKEPVRVGTPAENLIHRVASILGVSDDFVYDRLFEIVAAIEGILNLGALGKSRPLRGQPHELSCRDCGSV